MSNLPDDVDSIVDYLKNQGIPSDMVSRKIIAEKYGITPYSGTADQNTQLLALLRNPPSPQETFWDEIKAYFKKIASNL
jgi:hypothetical protein